MRHADCSMTDYLLLYINDAAIVLGKNQCIYKEVNFDFLRSPSLKLSRRISGGGTVYHDAGNVNFAFITSFANEKVNNYQYFNNTLIDVLRQAGIDAEMDTRNNILCGGKKISGNAQFTNRKNIISHGTLLFNADLPVLRACLKENDFEVQTKAVASTKSAVVNMVDFAPQFKNAKGLREYLKSKLAEEKTHYFSKQEWSEIEKLATDKFDSFEWVYARSPETLIIKPDVTICIERGLIKEIGNQSAHEIPDLIGVRYEWESLRAALISFTKRDELLGLLF